MTTFISTCPICGADFTNCTNADGIPHQKTCSIKCARISGGLVKRAKRIEHTCPICGKTFADIPSRKRKYCSRKCQGIAKIATRKTTELICEFCQQPFTILGDPFGWTTHRMPRFCSRECSGRGTAKEQGLHVRKKVLSTCLHCGTPFSRIPRHDGRKSLYCSRSCFHAHHRGSNHQCWQGGHDTYYGPNWEEQRARALARDKHICQVCGAIAADLDRSLSVHHITLRSLFNRDWEKANHLDNLFPVCEPCHGRIHADPSKFPNNPKYGKNSSLKPIARRYEQNYLPTLA